MIYGKRSSSGRLHPLHMKTVVVMGSSREMGDVLKMQSKGKPKPIKP